MKRRRFISFQAKILAMIALAMSTLMGVTIWIVNSHVSAQLEHDAADSLITADSVFRNIQRVRAKNLLLRFGNVPNEPRFKAVSQLGEANTMQYLLRELSADYDADAIVFTRPDLTPLASVGRTATVDVAQFELVARDIARGALNGQAVYSTDFIQNHIYDLVAVPVQVSGQTVGVLVFAIECGKAIATEFHQLTRRDLVFLANNLVTASTISDKQLDPATVAKLSAALDNTGTLDVEIRNLITKINIGSAQSLAFGAKFQSATKAHVLGYLVIASYDSSLAALQATQRSLVHLGIVGVISAMLVSWILVGRTTRPLRQLRDLTVAVGQGDFSRHADVRTHDECAQLADAFNQMTRNLAGARDQLEHTVETLRSTRDRLTQSEKLSAIGEFVAGVTHELNNPLTSVIGFAELMQQTTTDPKQRRQIDVIAREAHRCQKIVASLLSFSRQHKTERKPVNLNDVVDSAADILAYQLRVSNVHLERRLSPDLPPVIADSHQLQQVFINLLNNARQAIEGFRNDGRIRVTTQVLDQHLQIQITDNGPGISPENLAKIFEPFFTTKEIGKGTGLGLSLVYGILQEHGGNITVQSQPGHGATFTLTLPIAANPAAASLQDTIDIRVAAPRPTGIGAGKRVLIVDDEESILFLTRELLHDERFEVETAPDGETGLRKAREKQYDIILCDWKMPGLTGRELYEQLHRTHPTVADRVIFMTGDVINETTQQFLSDHRRQCLAKPFGVEEFYRIMASRLN